MSSTADAALTERGQAGMFLQQFNKLAEVIEFWRAPFFGEVEGGPFTRFACHGIQNQFAGVMELAPVPLGPLFVSRRQKGLNLRICPTRAVVMNMSSCLLNLCLVPWVCRHHPRS